MVLGFLTAQKPAYEDRVDLFDGEGPKLRALWADLEQKCFDQYTSVIDDDYHGVHPYQLLKHEITGCKQVMAHDNRRDVLRECHQKIVGHFRRCDLKNGESGASGAAS